MAASLIKSLGYVTVAAADIARWRQFAFDVLGFAEGSGPDRRRPVSADGRARRADHRRPRRRRPDRHRRLGGPRPRGVAAGQVGTGRGGRAGQGTLAGRRRRTPRRGGDRVRRSGGHLDRGVPRCGARPQPRGDAVRREVRHRRSGTRACRAARARRAGPVRLLHRGTGIRLARRVPGAGPAGVRPDAGPVPRASTSATTAWRICPAHDAARPRPDPPDGRGRHPRRRRARPWIG